MPILSAFDFPTAQRKEKFILWTIENLSNCDSFTIRMSCKLSNKELEKTMETTAFLERNKLGGMWDFAVRISYAFSLSLVLLIQIGW